MSVTVDGPAPVLAAALYSLTAVGGLDPAGRVNGYVIELTAKTPEHARLMDPATNGARELLDQWQSSKRQTAASSA